MSKDTFEEVRLPLSHIALWELPMYMYLSAMTSSTEFIQYIAVLTGIIIISSLSTAAESQSLLIRVMNRSNQYGVYIYDLNTELCTHHI